MKFLSINIIRILLAGTAYISLGALACEPEQDGCLGCNDEELRVCLNAFVEEICVSSGNPANCDSRRIYDDAERYVIISTGSHMSRIRSMARNPHRYQLH
jgi:hypothetical protein